MAEKHTPGPLEAIGNLVRTSMATGGFLVAECRDASGQPHSDEAKANAAAFSATPELIEACDLMLQWFAAEDNHSLMPDFYDRIDLCKRVEIAARAALAKARGDAVRDPDDFVECQACYGKGFNDVERQVAERKSDVQTFRETCEACDGTGKVNAGGVA